MGFAKFGKDVLAQNRSASGLQLGKLAGEVLRLGRDAGIAVNHAAILEQKCGTENGNLISALVLFQIYLSLRLLWPGPVEESLPSLARCFAIIRLACPISTANFNGWKIFTQRRWILASFVGK